MKKVNINIPNLSSLVPKFEIDANSWNMVENSISKLPTAIQKGYDKATDGISRKILLIVKRAIQTGVPPPNSGVQWAPLSPNTIRRYGAHNIYYLSGQYYQAINLFKYKSRILVGFPVGARHVGRGNQLTLNQLAKLLEFGNSKIPARPVWGPTLKSIGGTPAIKKIIMIGIRDALIKDAGIPRSQIQVKW